MSDFLDRLVDSASPAWLAASIIVNVALAVVGAIVWFW